MAEVKETVWTYFFFFALFAWFLNSNILQIVGIMSQKGTLVATAIYIFSNPVYLLIIFGTMFWHKDKIVKAFFAGISISLASDIVSFPRLLPDTNLSDLTQLTNIDTILAKYFVSIGVPFQTFMFAYYVIVPVSLVFLAINLLGYSDFLAKVKNIASHN